MSVQLPIPTRLSPESDIYPETDGLPMAENTLQFRWIMTIEGGLESQYNSVPDVFVAGDLFWYPVEGRPEIRTAPDVMVAFGRPKGDRRSYRQWEEERIAPQVVFEILSPSNRPGELPEKFEFYDLHGVREYYVFDPDRIKLLGWLRHGMALATIPSMQGWVSPLLRIRFELVEGNLHVFGADGKKFKDYVELAHQMEKAEGLAQEQARQLERLRAQLKAAGLNPDT
jgi:Uma2 family endonuclease